MTSSTHEPTGPQPPRGGRVRYPPLSHPIGVVGVIVSGLSLGAVVWTRAAGATWYYFVTLAAGLVMIGIGVLSLRRRRTEAALLDAERTLRRFQQAATEVRLHDVGDEGSIRDQDSLLFSRRLLEELLERDLRRAARERTPVTILLLHVGGVEDAPDPVVSALLRSAGNALQQQVRAFDLVCRYERQVLGVRMPGLSERQAARRARDLLALVEKAAAAPPHAPDLLLVASAGLATHRRLDAPTTAQALLRRAHLALYQSRLERDSRVVAETAPDDEPPGHAATKG